MQISDEEFTRLVSYVKEHYGINLVKKRILIEGRLNFTLIERGLNSYKEYLDIVFNDKSGEEMSHLLNKLTTNHTFFMRETEHFEYLENVVLPYLEETIKDRDIRIWSAGCSFGNEPYNLAMCIANYFNIKKTNWDCKILATDISLKALNIAKQGIYADNTLTDLPNGWLEKYFDKIDNGNYQVKKILRDEVVFKYFNLMDNIVYKKPFDLILCRNVMIYFDNDTKEQLINRFYDATKKGGFLFIGHAENITKNNKYKFIKPAIFRKE